MHDRHDADDLTIGEAAARVGLATSTLRYYEDEGLIASRRTAAGHRRYPREVLRRLSFVRVAQRVGLSLDEIRAALATLPEGRTPTRRDWSRLSASWRVRLDERIALLERLRDDLDGCIGCGCLSLRECALWNTDDHAAALGAGPRYLLGDERSTVVSAPTTAGRASGAARPASTSRSPRSSRPARPRA
jgi:MerR family transcriptional regulator, redox-sensitive transcriptional activator SoxR